MKLKLIKFTLLLLVGCVFYSPVFADREAELQYQREGKVAIVVGINSYSPNTGLRQLNYAIADAYSLKNVLLSQGYIVRILTNQSANKQMILHTIKEAGRHLKKGRGTLIFAYSGHGFASKGKNYLATYGAVINQFRQTALSLREVDEAIHRLGVKRAVLFIDAARNNPSISGAKETNKVSFIRTHYRTNILFSTKPGYVSWESELLEHSIFYYFLTRALAGEAANSDGIITFATIVKYVKMHVSNWTSHEMKSQYSWSNQHLFENVLILGQKKIRVTNRNQYLGKKSKNMRNEALLITKYRADRLARARTARKAKEAHLALLEKKLYQLKLAKIEFTVPERMNIDDAKVITLSMGLEGVDISLKNIETKEKNMKLYKESMYISDNIKANLVGINFKIKKISPDIQALFMREKMEWKWYIKPLKAGKQKLSLTIIALIQDKSISLDYKALEKTIDVEVTVFQTISNLIKQNSELFITTIFSILAFFLMFGMRIIKKRGVKKT